MTRTFSGSLHVVGLALVPGSGQQRFNRRAAQGRTLLNLQSGMSLQILDLLLEFVKDKHHGFGQVVHTLKATVAVGEDFAGTVVTTDYNITIVGVHHVVSSLGIDALSLIGPLNGGRSGHQPAFSGLAHQEALCGLLSDGLVNIGCRYLQGSKHESSE